MNFNSCIWRVKEGKDMPSYQEVFDALSKIIVYLKEEGGWMTEYLPILEELHNKMFYEATDGYG